MCTKIRWVVEATNSLLKQKLSALDQKVQNNALPHYLRDFELPVINKYCDRLKSDVGNTESVASNM